MQHETTPITEYVEKLGYKNSGKLANRIRDLLKKKEDFDKYLVDEDRPEKMMLRSEGKILVDNLAILSQFSRLFGTAEKDSGHYLPYRFLKSNFDKHEFTANINKQRSTLKEAIFRSNENLKNIAVFANSLLTKDSFDITKESLRELMNQNSSLTSMADLDDSFELGAWNEVLSLQEQIDSGDEGSDIYQELGEQLLKINEVEQAINALKESIKLEPKNGIAWAIYAKTLHTVLVTHNQEHYRLRAQIELNESIVNPLTSQEQWINERIDETSYQVRTSHEIFVQAAVNALLYWPDWGYGEKKNYKRNLNLSSQTQFDFNRDDLFKMLIDELSYFDVQNYQDSLIAIIRSFQLWEPDSYPMTNIVDIFDIGTFNFNFKVRMLQVFSLLSEEDEERAVKKLISDFHENSYVASENLKLLGTPEVRNIFFRYLGHDGYKNLYETLEVYVSENREVVKKLILHQVRLDEVRAKFSGLAKRHDILTNKIFKYSLENLTEAEALEGMVALDDELEQEQEQLHQNIRIAAKNSIKDVDGWQSYLELPFVDSAKHSFGPKHLYLLAPLIELIEGKVTCEHIKTLNDYIRTDRLVRGSVSYINSNIVNVFELFSLIPWDNLSPKQAENMDELLEILSQVQKDVEAEMEVEDDFYGP